MDLDIVNELVEFLDLDSVLKLGKTCYSYSYYLDKVYYDRYIEYNDFFDMKIRIFKIHINTIIDEYKDLVKIMGIIRLSPGNVNKLEYIWEKATLKMYLDGMNKGMY